jgi:hypothetical protein
LKKIILFIIISISSIFAQEEDFLSDFLYNSRSFFVAGIAHQNIDGYSNAQALHLSYNYMSRYKWGFDVGYFQSFYEAKSQTTGEKANFSSAYIFATYLVPLNKYMGFKSKAGYARNKSAEDGLGYGVDVIFQMTDSSGFSLGFHKMNAHINYFIVNTVYQF